MTTDRLDRIEAILERTALRQEQLAQQQQQFENRQEQFDARLDRIAKEAEERGRNIDARLDRLTQATEESRREIDLLAERMGEIAASVSSLKQDREDSWAGLNRFMGVMVQFQEQAAADRAEIRRIWEYLLTQHPNGHGGNQP